MRGQLGGTGARRGSVLSTHLAVVVDRLGGQLATDARLAVATERHLQEGEEGGGSATATTTTTTTVEETRAYAVLERVVCCSEEARVSESRGARGGGRGRTAVDPDGAGLDLLGDADGARDVAREDGSGEAVDGVVGLQMGEGGRGRERGGREGESAQSLRRRAEGEEATRECAP